MHAAFGRLTWQGVAGNVPRASKPLGLQVCWRLPTDRGTEGRGSYSRLCFRMSDPVTTKMEVPGHVGAGDRLSGHRSGEFFTEDRQSTG